MSREIEDYPSQRMLSNYSHLSVHKHRLLNFCSPKHSHNNIGLIYHTIPRFYHCKVGSVCGSYHKRWWCMHVVACVYRMRQIIQKMKPAWRNCSRSAPGFALAASSSISYLSASYTILSQGEMITDHSYQCPSQGGPDRHWICDIWIRFRLFGVHWKSRQDCWLANDTSGQ